MTIDQTFAIVYSGLRGSDEIRRDFYDCEREMSKDLGARGRLLLTIPQVQDELCIGRSSVYELIRSGQLATIHIGRSVRIPRTVLDEWLLKRMAGTVNSRAK